MTLGRRGREPAPRPEPEDPQWRHVELEELAPQRVVARSGRGSRLAPVLVAVPVIALLAVGLGAFGGRERSRTTEQAGASGSARPAGSHADGVPSAAPVTPIATPSVPCQPSTELIPTAYLSVEGTSTPPLFDEIEVGGSGDPDSTPPDFGEIPEYRRTEIPSDAKVFIGTSDDACALAWSIELIDRTESISLGSVANPARDPFVARQNRFDLPLARFRGADFNLSIELTYLDVARRAIWPIRILPFNLPTAELRQDRIGVEVVPGCELRLELANGYGENLNPCAGSFGTTPSRSTIVAGTALTFDFGDGWLLQPLQVECGTIQDDTFAPAPSGPCVQDQGRQADAWSLLVSQTAGVSTLAIAACALESGSGGANQVCGIWYATIDVVA